MRQGYPYLPALPRLPPSLPHLSSPLLWQCLFWLLAADHIPDGANEELWQQIVPAAAFRLVGSGWGTEHTSAMGAIPLPVTGRKSEVEGEAQ